MPLLSQYSRSYFCISDHDDDGDHYGDNGDGDDNDEFRPVN